MTKGEIDRLGQRIGETTVISEADLAELQQYRQTFQEPISNVFNYVLRAARKIDKTCIVTYRIKRIDTIIEKLHRFQDNSKGPMNLSRMWDIAGCRCILNSSDCSRLYQLKDIIVREYGSNCKINDHIAKPRDSGYRSLHIYVKDKRTQKPIEIQIRNREQHNWATLVEIVDLLYGARNKEQGANSSLGQFLLFYSKANELNEDDFSRMVDIGWREKVFERMSDVLTRNYLNIRRQWMTQKQRGSYFVIIANKDKSEIVSYPTFEEAETVYYEKYLSNRDSNVVLTHLRMPDFDQISMAYSNYVLAMHAFFDDYRVLVSNKIIECFRSGHYLRFLRYFKIYNRNVRCHFKNLTLEAKSIGDCRIDPSVPRNQVNKWERGITGRLSVWTEETKAFLKRLVTASRGSLFKRMLARYMVKRLGKAALEGQKV